MEMNQILLAAAIILLLLSLGVKGYGLFQLCQKDVAQEERLQRYRKTMPLTYLLLAPVVIIVIYLMLNK